MVSDGNYLCRLKQNAYCTGHQKKKEGEEVVLRLHHYNPTKNTVISVPETAETVIAYFLWEQNLAPALLAVFKGGRIEEFLPVHVQI